MNKALSGYPEDWTRADPPVASGALQIDVISDAAGWTALRADYDRLHDADPDAGIYLSHAWLDGLFSANPDNWRVLAVRDRSGYLGFLPLRVRLRWSRSKARFETRLNAAGRLDLSDYVGFVCDPAREGDVIAALAQALMDQPFSRLSLRYEPTGRRARMLADALTERGVAIAWAENIINKGTSDQLICPVVHLPETYDAYFATLSAGMRKRLRRAARVAAATDDVAFRTPSVESYAADRDRMLEFWAEKWDGDMPGAQRDDLVARYRDMLDRAKGIGALYMPMIWRGDRILGGLAHILDKGRGRAHSLIEGRAAETDDLDVGMLLMSYAIRKSIESGFSAYDMGHGNAPYKYRLGAQDETTVYLVADRDQGGFAPALLPRALTLTARMIRRGDIDMARAALAQIRAVGH